MDTGVIYYPMKFKISRPLCYAKVAISRRTNILMWRYASLKHAIV